MTVPTVSSDPAAEQLELRRKGRQRLIGAVTLALLAAVVVPMLLDKEPREKPPALSLAIPSKDGMQPLAAPSPGTAAAPGQSTHEPAPAPAPEAKVPTPAPSGASPSPERGEVAAPKATEPTPVEKRAATEPRSAPAPKLEGFAVQIGAFREEVRLSQARGKLTAARISHYTERLPTAGGHLTRLRAGPYASRAEADKAAAEIRRLGLDGRVVTLP